MATKTIKGLYRTKKYGKWKPFSVGVADEKVERHELQKRIIFQIKRGEHWNEEEGVDIVELRIDK